MENCSTKKTEMPPRLWLNSVRESGKEETHTDKTQESPEEYVKKKEGGGGSHHLQATPNCIRGRSREQKNHEGGNIASPSMVTSSYFAKARVCCTHPSRMMLPRVPSNSCVGRSCQILHILPPPLPHFAGTLPAFGANPLAQQWCSLLNDLIPVK